MKPRAGLFASCLFALCLSTAATAAGLDDYPTAARAEFVFACMKTNGETPDALRRCSCSIDIIATLLPYDRYVAAEAVASLTQSHGQAGMLMRSSALAKATLDDLRRAQAEAEIRCF
jgi:recombinational DNA repair protein (RecF pathway)